MGKTVVSIAVGAAIGANLRYLVALWAGNRFGTHFPFGTLIINITGSFALGLVYTLLLRAQPNTSAVVRAFVGVGLLGGFTTFSSFSYETAQLMLQGSSIPAFVNVLSSVLGGYGACLLGIALAQLVVGSG